MSALNFPGETTAATDVQSGRIKPIPAFYCCYLLRSTVNHGKLYVGSTPNPRRRLAQHNGFSNGGAKHTAKLRPWEMVMFVEGFMSRTGALQFEWSWQNTVKCRHVDSEVRAATHQSGVRMDTKTGAKKSKGQPKARTSLASHLGDLHVLLRSTYFRNWPLKVRFFSNDVYRVWQAWSDRVDGLIPDNIEIISPQHGGGIRSAETVDSSYNSMRSYLEKAKSVLDDSQNIHCGVCKELLQLKDQMIVVCPASSCRSTSHLLCLSSRFLEESGEPDQMVPSEGICVACEETVQWPMLMKELTLRSRGEYGNQPRKRRTKRPVKQGNSGAGSHVGPGPNKQRHTGPPVDDLMSSNGDGYEEGVHGEYDQDDEPLDESWIDALDVDSDTETNALSENQSKAAPTRVEIVIEDSECDEPEIID
ncbi:Slx4p interacting protein [Paecilomyces lecythidis]